MVIQSSAHAKRPFKGVTTFGIGYRMAGLLIGTLADFSVGKRCTTNLLADDDSACSGAVFMALSYEKPISRVFFSLFSVSFETLRSFVFVIDRTT